MRNLSVLLVAALGLLIVGCQGKQPVPVNGPNPPSGNILTNNQGNHGQVNPMPSPIQRQPGPTSIPSPNFQMPNGSEYPQPGQYPNQPQPGQYPGENQPQPGDYPGGYQPQPGDYPGGYQPQPGDYPSPGGYPNQPDPEQQGGQMPMGGVD